MTPDVAADRRLHPATLAIGFLRMLPQAMLGLPALVGFASDASLALLLGLAGAGVAVSFGISLLRWRRFRYGVDARAIVIESGLFQRQRRVIPIARVQDVDIEQSLLPRLLGLAKVRIETGGSAKDEGALDAVSLAEAHRLRDELRRARHGIGAAADADAEGEMDEANAPDEPLLFAMSFARLIGAGMLNFSLLYLAAIFGGLQYLEPVLGIDLWDWERWLGPAERVAAHVTLLATLSLALLLLTLGVVTGIARTVAADYGFRLTRAASGLRRRRGLFTLSEVVVPLRRVQLAALEAGLAARLLGWWKLSFQTLGADAAQSGRQTMAPMARADELVPILAAIGEPPVPPADGFTRVPRRHVLRQILPAIVLLGGASLAAGLFYRPALILLALLPPLVALALLRWRRHRYAIEGNTLYIAGGLLNHRIWIVPIGRIQTVSVDRGPVQRRLALATLAIDTAGAPMFGGPAITDLDAAEASRIARRLLNERERLSRRREGR